MRFNIDDEVLITNGEYRGVIGRIKKEYNISNMLMDYDIVIDCLNNETITTRIRSEDLKPTVYKYHNVIDPYEIASYLGPNRMREIAEDIYRIKTESFIDEMIQYRTNRFDSKLLDMVMSHVADRFIAKIYDKFQPKFEDKCKEIINDKSFVDNDDYNLRFKLETKISEYIDENKKLFEEDFKKIIKEEIETVLKKNIQKMLLDRFEDIFKELMEKE